MILRSHFFFSSLFQVECNLCQVRWSPKIWEHDLILRWVFLLSVSYIMNAVILVEHPHQKHAGLHNRAAGLNLVELESKSRKQKEHEAKSADLKSSRLSAERQWHTCQFVGYIHELKTKNWFFLLLQILSCEAWVSSWGGDFPPDRVSMFPLEPRKDLVFYRVVCQEIILIKIRNY